MRYKTLYWGISDLYLNAFLMLIGKAVLICLQVLPMTVMLMYIVPANIEASCFAVITAILTFSTDWAGDVVGAFIC